MVTVLICCLVTLFSCFIGTICGMGGGIIIKPVIDATGIMPVSTITFVSGLTVIAMTCWSVGKSIIKKETVVDFKTTPFLTVGAAVGGLIGKEIFNTVAALFADANKTGGVQACLLLFATFLTLIYTLKKDKLPTKNISSPAAAVILGLLLGILGSFLGVGGGPFNVAALCYFFSMPTKKATQNSLFVILFCQLTSSLKTVFSKGIPEFDITLLLAMIVIAIFASELGRRVNKKIDDRQAAYCLDGAMILIMCINIYNIYKYLF